jgi:Cu(I)/Ag(I) efflux system membrane fusion protein
MLAVGTAGGYWWATRASAPAVVAGSAQQPSAAPAKAERKVLYYRNPMGLPDTSPTPKKDPMGMDYIPVYDGEEPAADNQIRIGVDKVQKLGVRAEPAALRSLSKSVMVVGRIEVDERRVFTIAPKFEGWVERLHVNATGQPVAMGQPLFDAYSPELVSAQREYAIATEAVKALKDAAPETQQSMKRLAESSLARLKNWDVSEDQLRALTESGEARRTIAFRSPVAGVVTEKKALQGMRFMPGEALYQIADLSAVWVVAEVHEQDIGSVRAGARARFSVAAYPDRVFEGRITYVYPMLKPETRTIPVRIEVANPGLALKPAMFANVDITVPDAGKVLTVPNSAVIDSGTRRIVLVQLGEGRFESREVKLGARGDSYVEVVSGVKEGEPVVVSANFLIDAESNLKAAVSGFGAAASPPTAAPATSARGSISKVGHKARGTVQSVDAKAGTLSIAHGPVETLKWPAMEMEFKAANGALLASVKPGTAIAFEFVERAPGEWVVTRIAPDAPAGAAKSGTTPPHSH